MSENEGMVTGVGGIFFKCRDRNNLVSWYQDKLGFPFDGAGASFVFREDDDPEKAGYFVWGPFGRETEYFRPSGREFMINLRVRGIEKLVERLKKMGVEQIGEIEEFEYGKFAWIMDPEGTKIELWEQVGDPQIVESGETGQEKKKI